MAVAQTEQLPKPSSLGIGAKIAFKAKWVAKRTNTVGWCFKAIKVALKPFGVSLEGVAAYLAKEQLQADRRFEQKKLEELQPGDILVHGKSDAHPYGHICIYLGNQEEASDHVQSLIIGGGYGDTCVFRIKPWNPVGAKLVGPA